MARYLLIGAVGGPNFGDELILLTWINAIRQKDPQAQIFCDGYNLENLKEFVGELAIVVAENESLWRVCSILERDNQEDIWAYIRDKVAIEENNQLMADCLFSLREKNFDQIHIIGGGYFNSLWQSNYLILVICVLLSWQTGVRLIATGLGLTPTSEGDLSGLRAILGAFDLVDVRDEDSYNLLRGITCPALSCTGDDVLLSLTGDFNKYPLQEIEGNTLILCLQNDLFDGLIILDKIFTDNVFDLLIEHSVSNVIFAMAMKDDVSGQDSELKRKFANYNFKVRTIFPEELVENGFPVSSEGLIISSRYHPHFLGALNGVRGIALTSQPYYDTKHEAVHAMGSNWRLLNSNEFCDEFASVLKDVLLEDKKPYRDEDRAKYIQLKNGLLARVFDLKKTHLGFPIDVLNIWQVYFKQLAEAKREYNIADMRSNELRENINEKNNKINDLTEQVNEKNNKINEFSEQIQVAVKLNDDMIRSFSWRITAPMRYVFSKFKKI